MAKERSEALTAAQMRAIEAEAMATGKVSGLALMERAGRGVLEAVFAHWPLFAEGHHRAVILCGPGNNGGDGFVVARLLRGLGWQVEAFLWGPVSKLPPDARTNFDRLDNVRYLPDEIETFEDAASHAPDLRADPAKVGLRPFLLVDALFGIGLKRPLPDMAGLQWHWDYLTNFDDLNDARVVAIDVPSGLDADTGNVVGGADVLTILAAHLTVTFHRLKRGHIRGDGSRFCGEVVVKDIGL
ncbi:MAG: NAD(P)H-hydrate epimerase [Pseudomonadota bacterium]